MLDLASSHLPLHQILTWGTRALAGQSSTPKLDAELLLGAVLGLSRTQVLARGHTQVRRAERGHFAALIQRRQRGEPVAYILGVQPFYGRDFFVDRRVLIPRPETEELVDRCLDAVEALTAPRVADIGTGSGAIAVTLAAERGDLTVSATDASAEALEVAQVNARRHRVAERIIFHVGSLLAPLAGAPPFDLIVANLPYVGTDERETLQREVRDFEPAGALFAGAEGLALFPPFFEQASGLGLLRAGGTILLEIGITQGEAVAALARAHFPAATVAIHPDLSRRDRFVEVRLGAAERPG